MARSDPVGPMFYAGNPLDRVSWLREDAGYLQEAYKRPDARFILLNNLDPLVAQSDDGKSSTLLKLTRTEIADYLPDDAFESEADKKGPVKVEEVDAANLVIFLGVEAHDSQGGLLPEKDATRPHAPPVFAVDITPHPSAREALLGLKGQGKTSFMALRAITTTLPIGDVAIAGLARALLDWNRRNRFCAGCGRPQVPSWGGWKRACRPDPESSGAPPCMSKKGVHNYTYPRTDAVTIMAVLHPTEDKILLGRQRIWPSGFISCLAGFLEPEESLEEAVAREVWEESGVRVRNVRYVRSQPWPFPNSLMIGCVAEAEPHSEIRTDLDNELEHAGWYTRDEVLDALSGGSRDFTQKEREHIEQHYGKKDGPGQQGPKQESIRLPPASAIAHHLIKLWAIGEVKRVDEMPKGKM